MGQGMRIWKWWMYDFSRMAFRGGLHAFLGVER